MAPWLVAAAAGDKPPAGGARGQGMISVDECSSIEGCGRTLPRSFRPACSLMRSRRVCGSQRCLQLSIRTWRCPGHGRAWPGPACRLGKDVRGGHSLVSRRRVGAQRSQAVVAPGFPLRIRPNDSRKWLARGWFGDAPGAAVACGYRAACCAIVRARLGERGGAAGAARSATLLPSSRRPRRPSLLLIPANSQCPQWGRACARPQPLCDAWLRFARGVATPAASARRILSPTGRRRRPAQRAPKHVSGGHVSGTHGVPGASAQHRHQASAYGGDGGRGRSCAKGGRPRAQGPKLGGGG